MPWSDINLNEIKKGMITRGPASLSWTEYLNVFHKALIERQFFRDGGGDPITYEPLFNKFQIANLSDIRSLIHGYFVLWKSEKYYSEAVYSDLNNYIDYELTDQDLINIIGQEVFSLMDNVNSLPFYKIYRADVFLALYEIYKLTLVYESTLGTRYFYPKNPATARLKYNALSEPPLFNNSYSKEDTFNQAFNDALNGLTSDPQQNQSVSVTYSYEYSYNYPISPDQWRLRITGLQRNKPLAIMKQLDLEGNIIESKVAMLGSFRSNIQSERIVNNISNASEETRKAYIDSYPDTVNSINFLNEVLVVPDLQGDGTVLTMTTADSQGSIPVKVNTVYNPTVDDRVSGSCTFIIDMINTPAFISLNSPELEFYIGTD
ncbi:MAG: hypothetical protein GY928_24165 [Colwellia sp.]|nr:hypothetical protein [Colwellia sp.]